MTILVIDDEAAVRDAYRLLFSGTVSSRPVSRADALAEELFGAAVPQAAPGPSMGFEISLAAQGLEGVELAARALQEGTPFKVAFVDVRMPPGIDGKETARRLRALDPDLNIVIVSAWSDHSVTDITAVAGPADKIFYICKPFEPDEVRQMARALSERWDNDTRQLMFLRAKVAELAASEARAQHMASHDFLTGAANRMAFQNRLIERLEAGTNDLFVAFLDLDHFKHVNDTFGHDAGDEVIRMACAAFVSRAPAGTMVARLGGDEFGVLLTGMDRETAVATCQGLLETCSGDFSVFGNSVFIGASCGLVDGSCHPGCDAADLMRFADLALFAAKQDGGQTVRVFDKQLDASQQFRQRIEAGLFYALASEELSIHYQPIVASDTLDVVGYEALLRWNSRDYGTVPPGVFMPIAEESPVTLLLGDWVVERVLRDARGWPGLFTAINFSPRQFQRQDFVARLAAEARQNGLAPALIQIEVTETTLRAHARQSRKIVDELRAQGFRVAIDDFGTGASSIASLQDLAVDAIKIDRSFIEGMDRDRPSAAIVTALSHLAAGLGLEIVAEGVERISQRDVLRQLGCTHLQGFLFGQGQAVDRLLSASGGEPGRSAAG
ncbi:putative bifunctional diguanylate cyclase/phosphodiesterase [Rhodobacter capsulatus]|jgi:diguanylate cyclase (GGDEF)-like protein|uniref:Response regulator receiver modulated diguanylate cyclase/phosphodiesterase n=1 Tax=Rhodobacter capsulatus (strain ATCC BAA-309 / NBRC 16581 / SB1003) TaxID=272942 RepID=D5ANN1_RHOCB|nr:EAL domain-containing protein [Rhodobacter capsulatus]ADE84385.1 response regulator receiver modulated diguanylate cyclase/phosphodiesterase [Rhodobacter capsulatus SB 1003]ETD87586.1 diguanylate cyclase [Rhodobacter capsulatus B6]ETD89865.1 diguanylate cyclase [Rhodobacter capsulatus YW2]MDS0926068.1 EAL domain-containing protein [Rhodobacter capsulatus]TQD34098.1 GGDEF domain-containing response regulator [Rhodobacter capsulatus]